MGFVELNKGQEFLIIAGSYNSRFVNAELLNAAMDNITFSLVVLQRL